MSGKVFIYSAFIRLMVAALLKEANAARNFTTYLNTSLVFPPGPNVSWLTLTMPTLKNCMSFCDLSPKCHFAQWVPCNYTCTILLADRGGLTPSSVATSLIDRMMQDTVQYS